MKIRTVLKNLTPDFTKGCIIAAVVLACIPNLPWSYALVPLAVPPLAVPPLAVLLLLLIIRVFQQDSNK